VARRSGTARGLRTGGIGTTPGISSVFPGAGRGGSPTAASSLVNFAKRTARTPGASAAGFAIPGGDRPGKLHQDCSSFTQAVFRRYGFSIGGNTYEQQHAGRAVSRNEIAPGRPAVLHVSRASGGPAT
jgi:cell wall-associated NlpC family hydrolase